MNRTRINNPPRKGFTLIEILLVLLITSVLVLGINAAFRQAHLLWSRAEKQRAVYQQTRLLFDTLTEELLCLYMPPTDPNQQSPPFALSALPDGSVQLSFLTLNPAWKNAAVSRLPAKVSYKFTTDSDSDRRILLRTEQLFAGEKAIGKEQTETIMAGFSAAVLQAADPNATALADSWKIDLHSRRIPPPAVKIQLTWPQDETANFDFTAVMQVPARVQLAPP